VEAAAAWRDRLKAYIAAALPDWSLALVVRALQALRGMALVAAAMQFVSCNLGQRRSPGVSSDAGWVGTFWCRPTG